jgi:DNA polymerase-3 subunit beta
LAAQDVDLALKKMSARNASTMEKIYKLLSMQTFLIEMLGGADTEQVVMELSTPTKAGIIKPANRLLTGELLMLVMPLMLD